MVHDVDGECQYWVGLWIVFMHPSDDYRQFRLVLAQLLKARTCRQCELVRAFGLERKMLGRASRQLRDRGLDSFFVKPTGRGPAKS